MKTWGQIDSHLLARGFHQSSIDQFFYFIDKPDYPRDFPRIIRNLLNTFATVENTPWLYDRIIVGIENQIQNLSEMCNCMISGYKSRGISITEHALTNPVYGRYEDCPVHAMLWFPPEPFCEFPVYYQIFAYTLMPIFTIRNHCRDTELKQNQLDRYWSCINNARIAIWKLSMGKNLKALDNNVVFQTFDELDVFINSLGADFHPLTIPAKYVKNDITPPVITITKPRTPRPPKGTISIISETEDDGTGLDIKIYKRTGLTPQQIEEREQIGVTANEDSSGVELVSFTDKSETRESARSNVQRCRLSNRAKNHLAMDNQLNKHRWELLDGTEISILINTIEDLEKKQQKSKYYPGDIDTWEFLTLLCLMFWSGNSLEKLVKFRLYRNESEVDDNQPTAGILFTSPNTISLIVVPATPERKIFPNAEQKKLAIPVANWFKLSLPPAPEKIIKQFLQAHAKTVDPSPFKQPLAYYEQTFSRFTKKIKTLNFTRFTTHRIASHIQAKINEHPEADLVTAMYLTGRENFLARNQSYYTSIPISKLQELYKSVCEEISEPAKTKIIKVNSKSFRTTTELSVGSPFTPTRKAVQNLISYLQKGFRGTLRKQSESIPLAHYHMLRYTAFLVNYATGYRAIHEPVPLVTEIDVPSGFAVIADKDSEDRYNSRLIWLPPVCAKQIQLFWEHAMRILPILVDHDPNILDLQSRTDRHFSVHALQFLGKNNKAAPLNPTKLAISVSRAYSLPVNSSRHYLRTNLLARRCPVEIIDAFLGHWERGEEPWGRLSGLSPTEYADTLSDYLVPLLAEDGWVALEGISR